MSIASEMKNNNRIETILEQADLWDLRAEVRATAIAILKDDPKLDSGSAYKMAAFEWDIL